MRYEEQRLVLTSLNHQSLVNANAGKRDSV